MRDVFRVNNLLRSLALAGLVFGAGTSAPAGPAPVLALNDPRLAYRPPPAIPYPASNPYSAAKAELGQALFYDTGLSSSGQVACATCHQAGRGWSDGLVHARGEGLMSLHSPSLIGVAWLDRLGWDGKYRDIESVTFVPLLSPQGMNADQDKLIKYLSSDPAYSAMFARAFPGQPVGRRTIEWALATFERAITTKSAPFDRWVAGDETAIPEAAKRGFALFTGKAKCAECHNGWQFTDGSFHDIGVAKDDEPGRGRFFPSSVKLAHAFKTPTLRDAARRAPYMHDGSIATLEEVIDLYDKGGIDRPSRAEVIKPLGLGPGEKADLIAFLNTLSDE